MVELVPESGCAKENNGKKKKRIKPENEQTKPLNNTFYIVVFTSYASISNSGQELT